MYVYIYIYILRLRNYETMCNAPSKIRILINQESMNKEEESMKNQELMNRSYIGL